MCLGMNFFGFSLFGAHSSSESVGLCLLPNLRSFHSYYFFKYSSTSSLFSPFKTLMTWVFRFVLFCFVLVPQVPEAHLVFNLFSFCCPDKILFYFPVHWFFPLFPPFCCWALPISFLFWLLYSFYSKFPFDSFFFLGHLFLRWDFPFPFWGFLSFSFVWNIHNCPLKQVFMTALKFLAGNPKLCLLGIGIYWLSFYYWVWDFSASWYASDFKWNWDIFILFYETLGVTEIHFKLALSDRTSAGKGWAPPHCLGGGRNPGPPLSLHWHLRGDILFIILIAHY